MSILNLSNYKSKRYNYNYLKLLPVASRERPPQAKEFEDLQDIIINPINYYSKCNFKAYEVLSGLKVISITSNSITLSNSRILINNYPVIIETTQETITSVSTSFIVYLVITIKEVDNKYVYNYRLNTTEGYPLIQCVNGKHVYLDKKLKSNNIRDVLFEIYGNFINWGLVVRDNCMSPGTAYIKGNKICFPYHTPITTNLPTYKVVITSTKELLYLPLNTKVDLNSSIELGCYKNNKWTPNLYNQQIRNKDVSLIQKGLNDIRSYLLETALLKPIDTNSNLITDTFNNTNNADTTNILFDCDIEQGNLILNKFSRITKDVLIINKGTNVKVVNGAPTVIIQNYTTTPFISQLQSDSFITTGVNTKGILKLGPTKLDTSIYKRTSDKTVLLTQTIVNGEVYGLTANSSDFRLTIGNKIISTIITTDVNGKALFSFSIPAGCSVNDVITVQNNTSSATSSLLDTAYSIDTVSSVGQTIIISEDNTTLVGGAIFIRRVNTTSPVIKVLLTKYNDKPQEVIAQTIINNNQISTSVNGAAETPFTFDLPVTLSKGKYSLLISTINSPIDLFLSNNSVLANTEMIILTEAPAPVNTVNPINPTGLIDTNRSTIGLINPQITKDLKFELYKPIYTVKSVPTVLTITDSIDKFDYIHYPGKFRINNIEFTDEAPLDLTNTINITLDVDKYNLVQPVLISTNKTKSKYISKTIRTNFKYSEIYLELDAIIPDSTLVKVFISSNQTYSWQKLTNPTTYLVDGNDQTLRYIYNNDLGDLTTIINQLGNTTEATRNYLTIRIDLSTESNNKPIVKGYKAYVQ